MSNLTVEIDVGDDEHLVAEAAAVGCTAVEKDVARMAGTYVFHVTGPREALLPLIAGWGYEEERDYRIIE